MAIRVPRGFEVSRPYYNEYCEGQRPVAGAFAKEAWTGLAYTRIDEQHHDPIVIEPGTLIGVITGGASNGAGKVVPAILGTGQAAPTFIQVGATNDWGLPSASGNHTIGKVKPLGVCYQPIYSFILQSLYTNYTRNTAVGLLTDYVIQIPAVTSEEVAIEVGDAVMLGTGVRHGSGLGEVDAYNQGLAGRYAAVKNFTSYTDLHDRVVGRCLRKVLLGTDSRGASAVGVTLKNSIINGTFTIDSTADREFSYLSKIQTVPGLTGLTGTGTKGVPGFFLGAKGDAAGRYYGLTLLIRL